MLTMMDLRESTAEEILFLRKDLYKISPEDLVLRGNSYVDEIASTKSFGKEEMHISKCRWCGELVCLDCDMRN